MTLWWKTLLLLARMSKYEDRTVQPLQPMADPVSKVTCIRGVLKWQWTASSSQLITLRFTYLVYEHWRVIRKIFTCSAVVFQFTQVLWDLCHVKLITLVIYSLGSLDGKWRESYPMDLIKVPTLIQMEFLTIINPVKAYCLQSGCVNCYLEQYCGFNLWEPSNPCSVEEVADDPKWFPSVLEKKSSIREPVPSKPYSLQTGWLIRCCMPQISFTQEFLMFTVRAWRRYLRTESSRSCQISKARSSPSTVSFTSMLFSCKQEERKKVNTNPLFISGRAEFQPELKSQSLVWFRSAPSLCESETSSIQVLNGNDY